jgi:hypothetical protein
VSPAFATPSVLIQTEVNPREIYIGDPIQYRVTVTYSSSVTPIPLKMEKAWGEFEILDSRPPLTAKGKEDKQSLRYVFIITTYSTGTLTIPALPLTFSMPGGTQSEAKTEEVSIRVKSLLEEKGDEGHLRPLKGVFNFRSYKWLWILLGVLAGLGLIYALVRWRKSRRAETQKSKEPARPAEVLAKEALDQLEQDSLLSQGLFKEFYLRLSVICREYLEHRYGMTAMEKTTSELMLEFRSMSLGMSVINILREMFENGDLVKFAKYVPRTEDAQKDLSRARQFIEMTTPQPKDEKGKEDAPI